MPTIYIVLDVGLQRFHGKIVTSFRFPPLTQGGSLLMDQMVSTHTPSHPHTLTTPSHPHTLTPSHPHRSVVVFRCGLSLSRYIFLCFPTHHGTYTSCRGNVNVQYIIHCMCMYTCMCVYIYCRFVLTNATKCMYYTKNATTPTCTRTMYTHTLLRGHLHTHTQ